jgi:hypothetical protein
LAVRSKPRGFAIAVSQIPIAPESKQKRNINV